MGKYEYPSVPTLSSHLTPAQSATQEPGRPFSFMPEPPSGRIRDAQQADMPPPPPIPAHLRSMPQPEQVQNLEPQQELSTRPQQAQQPGYHPTYSPFPQQAAATYPQSVGQQDFQQRQSVLSYGRSVTPAPAYPGHENPQEPDVPEGNQMPPTPLSSSNMTPRMLNKSTRSVKAPEVVMVNGMPPLPEHIKIEPDINPLSPSCSTPQQSSPMTLVNTYMPAHSSRVDHAEKGGSWKHGLCSCADTSTCLTGLFCPCVVYGKTQYRLGLRSENKDPTNMLGYSVFNGSCATFAILCGCNLILAAIQRTRIRKGYAMSAEAGNVGSDCGQALCCCCCTLAQGEKEVKWREIGARTAVAGSATTDKPAQYQSVFAMSYPAPYK